MNQSKSFKVDFQTFLFLTVALIEQSKKETVIFTTVLAKEKTQAHGLFEGRSFTSQILNDVKKITVASKNLEFSE